MNGLSIGLVSIFFTTCGAYYSNSIRSYLNQVTIHLEFDTKLKFTIRTSQAS